MGRISKTLVTAALAIGGVMGATSPAMAGGDLVDIKVGDVILFNDIDVDAAAALCGILDVNALVADLNEGDNEADCLLLSPAKVIKS